MTAAGRPMPDLAHPLHGPFWLAAAAKRLTVQECEGCGYRRWPPAPICPECLRPGGGWVDIPGGGMIWSIATYEHAYEPSLQAELPYTCVLVELDAGPRMISRMRGTTFDAISIGARVRVAFEELAPGVWVPWFELVAG